MRNDPDKRKIPFFQKFKDWVIGAAFLGILLAFLVAAISSHTPEPYKEFEKAQSK